MSESSLIKKNLGSTDQITDLEITKTFEKLSESDKKKFQKGAISKFISELQEQRIRKRQYLGKLKTACDAELLYFKQQIDIRLKSSERITKAVYEEMLLRARTIREGILNSLNADAQQKFQDAIFQAEEDYENALLRCKLPDTGNELIDNARKKQIENCTKIYERGIEALLNRMKTFYADWGDPQKGAEILSLD